MGYEPSEDECDSIRREFDRHEPQSRTHFTSTSGAKLEGTARPFHPWGPPLRRSGRSCEPGEFLISWSPDFIITVRHGGPACAGVRTQPSARREWSTGPGPCARRYRPGRGDYARRWALGRNRRGRDEVFSDTRHKSREHLQAKRETLEFNRPRAHGAPATA